ncbi:MAG: hypothetical protein AB7I27_18690 [Bacteriovoracaceae bacterium]
MNTKENVTTKIISPAQTPKAKPKSLRPMRSMVAVRSLKPKTLVAHMPTKTEEIVERN